MSARVEMNAGPGGQLVSRESNRVTGVIATQRCTAGGDDRQVVFLVGARVVVALAPLSDGLAVGTPMIGAQLAWPV